MSWWEFVPNNSTLQSCKCFVAHRSRSLCSGQCSSHFLQRNNHPPHLRGGQDATKTHQQDVEYDDQPWREKENHRGYVCQSECSVFKAYQVKLYGRLCVVLFIVSLVELLPGGKWSDWRDESEARGGLLGPGYPAAWSHWECLSSCQRQSRRHQNTPQRHRAHPQTPRRGAARNSHSCADFNQTHTWAKLVRQFMNTCTVFFSSNAFWLVVHHLRSRLPCAFEEILLVQLKLQNL